MVLTQALCFIHIHQLLHAYLLFLGTFHSPISSQRHQFSQLMFTVDNIFRHIYSYIFFFISLPSSILYVVFENTNNSLSVDWTLKGYTPCGGLLGDRTCSGIQYNVVRPGVSAYHVLSNHYFVNTMQH